jgi:Putative zinc-finger/HEAT repeats
MSCGDVRDLIVLMLYGEVSELERPAFDAHLEGCSACRAALASERRLRAVLAERAAPQPGEALLARCRADLQAALEREPAAAPSAGAPRPADLPRRAGAWTRVPPALAAALLAAGFLAGWLSIAAWNGRPASRPAGPHAADLNAVVSGTEGDRVRLDYDVMQRTSLEGRVDDPRIRGLLVQAVGGSPNAGLRLDALDLLREHTDQPQVRQALLRTVQEDRNPGARLKALEALGGRAAADGDVRRALERALLRDDNPGVRVRALDLLTQARSPETLPVLRSLARQDPNQYVRLKAAAYVDQAVEKEAER